MCVPVPQNNKQVSAIKHQSGFQKEDTQMLHMAIADLCSLTPEQKLSFTRVNNFFCGLHFIVGLADTAAETIKKWESFHMDEDNTSSEAGTIRLIRSACKAIQKQCSQQAGCHIMFKAYLKAQGISIFPIAKFQGNHFNIV